MARRVKPTEPQGDPFLAFATEGMPFSNATEGHAWQARWCDRCTKEPDCELLTAAVLDMTPHAWKGKRPDYECKSFTKIKGAV